MKHRIWPIALLATPLLLSAPLHGAVASASCDRVPLFARFATDGPNLQSYAVPIHADITLHRIFNFHFGLDGDIQYKQPGEPTLNMRRVPEKQRQFFARLAMPRTWSESYDLRVTGTNTLAGHTHYTIRGEPKSASDGIDHFVADVSDELAPPLEVVWFLRGGGTVTMRIQTALTRGYVMPVRERTDIKLPGYTIHAEVSYGDYALNSRNITKS